MRASPIIMKAHYAGAGTGACACLCSAPLLHQNKYPGLRLDPGVAWACGLLALELCKTQHGCLPTHPPLPMYGCLCSLSWWQGRLGHAACRVGRLLQLSRTWGTASLVLKHLRLVGRYGRNSLGTVQPDAITFQDPWVACRPACVHPVQDGHGTNPGPKAADHRVYMCSLNVPELTFQNS